MNKFLIPFLALALAIPGIIAVLIPPPPARVAKKEVPDRPTHRRPASSSELGSSSQPAALSVRPAGDILGGLNLTEEQILLMEKNFQALQKDVSVFKDTQAWVIRFNHPSPLMSRLGVKDGDKISFRQIQLMKQEPGLANLSSRLEMLLAHLQK